MGALSNQLLVFTIVAYIIAMFSYAVEFAFGSRGVVARVAVRQRALVSVGAPEPQQHDPPVVDPTGPDQPAVDPTRLDPSTGGAGRAVLAGRIGVWLTAVAVALHLAVMVTRGIAAGRAPWGNLYEFVIAIAFFGVVAWLVLLVRKPMVRQLGLFVTMVVVLGLSIAGMSFYTPAGPLVPALNSYWLLIHVTSISLATGILLVGFVAATMHLVRAGHEDGKRSFPYTLGERMPAADALERLTFRVHAFAFPLLTFAIICGAIWAESAWGRYWGWDPKEIWSFITWVVYACYLHARATPSVKRTVASWVAIAGWAVLLFNIGGVNLFISGLHSYAGT